jgi:hypothetical protein
VPRVEHAGTVPPVEELVELAEVEELVVEELDEAVAPPVPEVALLVVCPPPEPEVVPDAPVAATGPPHAGRKTTIRIAMEERMVISMPAA